MPAMGESVAEGTVLEWHKQEGDSVAVDETLVEISTDKVDAEVPSPAAGKLVKILVAEGDTVAVGDVLAEISTDGSGNGQVEAPEESDESPTPEEPDESQAAPEPEAPVAEEPAEQPGSSGNGASATAQSGGKTVDIVTPTGGESVTEGTILEWSVKVGDTVKDGDTVVEISTDKVDMELPAPASGTITEILAQDGETVSVGQVIARMTVGSAQAPAADRPEPEASPDEDQPAGTASAPTDGAAGDGASTDDANASPVARRLAAAEGIDLSQVQGSARGGRITKSDVLAAAGNGASAAKTAEAPKSAAKDKPAGAQLIKGGGAALARYMDQSRSIPTATSFRTLTVTVLDARRKQLKQAGQKVSFTHLIAYAIAKVGTEDMPVMAHHFDEIDGKPHRIDDGAVNLGLAVDVEKKDGSRTLMVPVIRDAGRLSFKEFLDAYNALVDKARTNSLTADDLTGGNVSLTNPGGIGTIASVPRLMVGQGTIVATGSIAYPVGLGNIAEAIGAEKVMTMTSTYDHRIIQGAESGRFLQRIEAYLQGEEGFYESVFADLGVDLPELPPPPAPTAVAPVERRRAPEPAPAASAEPSEELLQAVQAATSLLKAHRTHGHLAARLDPLGREPESDPALDPEPLGLTPELMQRIPSRILRMWVPGATLAESLPHLRETYCGPIAYEIEHIASHRQRLWLREAIESGQFRQPLRQEEQKALLKRLTEVDALERFMHKAYLGQKQFSVEGLDMTVPMIDEIIQLSATRGAREVVIGMAHRGRLNVLAHNLGRPYGTIFAEFEGSSTLDQITTIPQGGTGDVKYHHGAQGSYQIEGGESIIVRLESNPSHLEFVAPVASGATRAAQTTRQGPHAHQDTNAAIPIILHGDAAFPGQGVVAETLNLQALDGYTVGGTIHLIQNNQVGFTTDPEDARSTTWASDLAKGFDVPIIHVNSDDVAACVAAIRLAFAFRQEFGHDVLIDLIGYRRFGHNEADEPAYTQPEMYQVIKKHPPVRELYARQLIEAGIVTEAESTEMTDGVWSVLSEEHQELKERIARRQGGRARHRRVPARPHPIAGGQHRGLGRPPAGPQRGAALGTRRLHRPSQAGQAARAASRRARSQGRDRLGPRRGAGLRLAAHRGDPDPPDRPGFRARHLQPAPPRAARPEDRPGALRDAASPRRPGADGAPQQPAVGDGLPGLRVRLFPGRSGDAGPVGGAVRRLRQQRPGDHRPVHRLRSGQVGPDLAAHPAAAPRLRGLGSRALLGPARALPAAGRRGQHPGGQLHDPGPVLPPTPPAGPDRQAAATGDHDPEEAAPALAGHQQARGAGRRPVPSRAPGARNRSRAGHPPDPVQRQDLLRRDRPRVPPGQARGGRRPDGAALSLPAGRGARVGQELSEPQGGGLGPGGAAEHGRPRTHGAQAPADPPGRAPLRLHRPPRAGRLGRGLPDRPRQRAEPDRLDGAGPGPARFAVPAQAPRRALTPPTRAAAGSCRAQNQVAFQGASGVENITSTRPSAPGVSSRATPESSSSRSRKPPR